jgi:hypothetical protein
MMRSIRHQHYGCDAAQGANMQKSLMATFLVCGLLLVGQAPTYAQASRTWVSGVGNDANPCSRTAPCKTFAGAISKTAAGGEISVLDPGGYGALTITKSLSIVSEGSEGSILVAGTNGININAAATDVVSLHGIFLEGFMTGIAGINVLSAREVHIRHCYIRNFLASSASAAAIRVAPTATSNVFVSDCTLSNNTRGVLVVPSGATKASVALNNVVVERSTNTAIISNGANAKVFLNNSTIAGNTSGLSTSAGGQIISFGNNAILNNDTDGAVTSTVLLK